MKIFGEKVECLSRNNIPLENETISDDFEIEKMIPFIKEITIYPREKENCPFSIGNWMVDIRFISGALCSIKLPREMDEKDVMRFCQPLIDLYKLKKFN